MRILGPVLILGGVLVAFSPRLGWFTASVSGEGIRVSGLAVAGELAVGAALGVVILLLGLALTLGTDRSQWRPLAAVTTVVSGFLATTVTLAAVIGTPVSLIVADGGVDQATAAPVTVLTVGPALSFLGAAIAIVAGALALREAARG